MADDQAPPTVDASADPKAEQLTDELAKKYDPERLLRVMKRRAGKGEALDHSVRARYEKRFGVDLGHVRIVTGEFAEEFNRQRNAYAVTIGSTGMILMGNSPDRSMASRAGQALLAHELTHVAQAKAGMHRSARGGMEFAEEHEEEAEEVEHEELHEHMSKGLAEMAKHKKDDQKQEEQLERIKERVMEMLGDAASGNHSRSGPPARRP